MKIILKVHGPICQMEIFIQMMHYHPRNIAVKFQLQTVWLREEIMYIAIAYTLLCKVNYGYYN